MDVDFSKQFVKDFEGLPEAVKKKVKKVIEQARSAQQLREINDCKKLTDTNFFRVRIGDYRIVLTYENNVVFFRLVAHRGGVYK